MPVNLSVEINSGNAAFTHDGNAEAARILRAIASQLDSGLIEQSGPCMDINGNKVGTWTFAGGFDLEFHCQCGNQWCDEFAADVLQECDECGAPVEGFEWRNRP